MLISRPSFNRARQAIFSCADLCLAIGAGQIGDRCLQNQQPDGNYECAGGAWCHELTMTCYESCTGPDNTDVPRVDRWGRYTESGQFCDYSGVPMSTRIPVRACSLIMSARFPVSPYPWLATSVFLPPSFSVWLLLLM